MSRYPWAHLIDSAWARFVAKIDARDPNACWPWMGARSRGKGNRQWYGSFRVGPYVVRAHIFMCAAAGMEIPLGHHRDHECVNTLCVNPAHFEGVTPRENSLRRWRSSPRKIAA